MFSFCLPCLCEHSLRLEVVFPPALPARRIMTSSICTPRGSFRSLLLLDEHRRGTCSRRTDLTAERLPLRQAAAQRLDMKASIVCFERAASRQKIELLSNCQAFRRRLPARQSFAESAALALEDIDGAMLKRPLLRVQNGGAETQTLPKYGSALEGQSPVAAGVHVLGPRSRQSAVPGSDLVVPEPLDDVARIVALSECKTSECRKNWSRARISDSHTYHLGKLTS